MLAVVGRTGRPAVAMLRPMRRLKSSLASDTGIKNRVGEDSGLLTLRQAVTTRVATLIPAGDRRAVVDRWAEVGDEYAQTIKDAENEIARLKSQLEDLDAEVARYSIQAEKLKEYIKSQTGINANDATHDTFGMLIRDMGYKKVYCASVRQLSALPIWECQRILRTERAHSIATEKRKKGFPVKFPGVLTLYTLPDGQYKLLDGQHRLAALRMLADTGIVNGDSNLFLVEVFHLQYEHEAKDLFAEINKAQPVQLIDLPDEVKADYKKMVNMATDALKEAFPEMFKVSINCKLPHLNIDNLRNDLYRHGAAERHNIRNAEELVTWMKKANESLAQKTDDEWKAMFKGRNPEVIDRAIAKCRKNKFYLGIDRAWLNA